MDSQPEYLAGAEASAVKQLADVLSESWRVRSTQDRVFRRRPVLDGETDNADVIASAPAGTMIIQVKATTAKQAGADVVLAGSSAAALRRSVPGSAGRNRAVLVLLANDTRLNEPARSFEDDIPQSLLKLGRRLSSKSGYDAVLFSGLDNILQYSVLVTKAGFTKRFFDISSALEVLGLVVFAKHKQNDLFGLELLRHSGDQPFALALEAAPLSMRPRGIPNVQAQSPLGLAKIPDLRKFLLVADEWNAGKGGITSFNRELALALTRAGKEVCVYLPEASVSVLEEARGLGIDIAVPASLIPGISGASALLAAQLRHSKSVTYAPDVVIGHGRVLGPHA